MTVHEAYLDGLLTVGTRIIIHRPDIDVNIKGTIYTIDTTTKYIGIILDKKPNRVFDNQPNDGTWDYWVLSETPMAILEKPISITITITEKITNNLCKATNNLNEQLIVKCSSNLTIGSKIITKRYHIRKCSKYKIIIIF